MQEHLFKRKQLVSVRDYRATRPMHTKPRIKREVMILGVRHYMDYDGKLHNADQVDKMFNRPPGA